MWTILNITYKTKAKIGVHPNYAIEDDPNWLTGRDQTGVTSHKDNLVSWPYGNTINMV